MLKRESELCRKKRQDKLRSGRGDALFYYSLQKKLYGLLAREKKNSLHNAIRKSNVRVVV
jgi:hypothetical protein